MRVRSMDPFIYTARTSAPANLPVLHGKVPSENEGHYETEAKTKDTISKIKKFISRFEKDDYILIGIIAVLFFEGSDDYVLMAVLGYLFMMGVI